ncbi:MAG: hypothetical protein M1833_004122 [Piccolia ochrophora]|nr:MAG: hypothetical protein M1833_004122 [Piccolia ochrophora]
MAPRINIPPFTRILLASLVLLSLIVAIIRQSQTTKNVPYLTLVPQRSIFYPWVFVTTTFVEQNIVSLVVTAVTIFYGGKYLERAWSSAEFAKFIIVTTIIPNVLTSIVFVFEFAMTGSATKIFEPINGGAALQAGFLVAFKQLVPEHTVTIAKGLIKIRVKHFPALFLLLNILAAIIFGTQSVAVLSLFGFFASWVYLRFFKATFPDLSTSQPSSLRGDASETFAFAYFFPEPLHGPIAGVSDAVYNVLVSVKVCTPFTEEDVDVGNTQAAARGEGGLPSLLSRGGAGQAAPGSARAEAERRRALALKALDQRLHAATSRAQPPAQASTPSGVESLGATDSAAETQGHEAENEQSQH